MGSLVTHLLAAIAAFSSPMAASAVEALKIDIPLFPEDYGVNAPTELKKAILPSTSELFPEPACLAGNIAFWKSVYTEVDDTAVVFHDREDLSRVYGTMQVPGAKSRSRQRLVSVYREYFARKLRELADVIERPSLWQKLHRELATKFPPEQRNRAAVLAAAENLRTQGGLRQAFQAGISRSLVHLPTVVSEIERTNLPIDLAYLPHVESSYNPQAVSHAGAVGMWQIMPSAMRHVMGGGYVHARKNPEIATRAALKILKGNYDQTRNWPLALTAYNHGLNGVLRAIRSTGSSDICAIYERYKGTAFGFASKNFYAQFLAARQIARDQYRILADNGRGPGILRQRFASKAGNSTM